MQKLLLSVMIGSALAATAVQASSHREAPGIARAPALDSTDFYAFNSYESGREGYVTLIANYIPRRLRRSELLCHGSGSRVRHPH